MARVLRAARLFLPRPLSPSSAASTSSPQGFCKQILSPTSQLCSFSSSEGSENSKPDVNDCDEARLKQKDLVLQQALDQISAVFGREAIMWLSQSRTPKAVPVISTGSFLLDLALGIGGLPKGRFAEIYGPEASGKTTLALHVIAEAQKHGGYCAFIDAEHALDPTLAESIGVKSKQMLLSQPDSGEQALGLADMLIRSGSVDVVVVDSVAALVPKAELSGEMGDAHVALQARLMSQALRKLSHSLSRSQTILLFVNQVRSKLSTFGEFGVTSEVTCGGNALKFYASVRLSLKRIGLIKKAEEVVGTKIQVRIVKNKLAPPFKTVQLELEFGKGISRDSEIIELGCEHKLITKSGSLYYFNGESFHGKDAIKQYFAHNEGARESLMVLIREKMMMMQQELEAKRNAEDAKLATSSPEEFVSATDDEAPTVVQA